MNIAACCMVYNRPEYFKMVLPSLLENKGVDWYFFIDGPVDSKVKECKAMLKGENFVDSSVNLGTAKNKQRAHELFKNYDVVIFFEDDMIVSPYYVKILLKLYDQFSCVVGAPDNKLEANWKENLFKAKVSNRHFWGYLMDKKTFLLIENSYNCYVEDVGNNYIKRNHRFLKEKYNLNVSSHDGAIGRFLFENGISRVNTIVPRGKYIGAEGVHFSKESFAKKGFGKEKPIVFEKDQNPEDFVLY